MSRRTGDTRVAILDAARSLYEAQGYFGVGMEAVAKKAGVSRRAVYLHFASKADLLGALHERVFAQDVGPVQDRLGLWEAATAKEGLDVWVAATTEVAPRIMGIAKALSAARLADPDVDETWRAPRAGRHGDCLRMVKWLKREGELKAGMSVGHAADVLFTLASLWSYDSLVNNCGWSPRQYERWLRQTLRRELLDAGA